MPYIEPTTLGVKQEVDLPDLTAAKEMAAIAQDLATSAKADASIAVLKSDDNESDINTLQTQVKGIINVAEYGAVGDGITSDQTAIVNAIADAKAKGYALHWGHDARTYLLTDTVPDFHKVSHIGNGVIKRGTDLFYLSPTGTQRNKIYVATSAASNTFDGLTANKPVARLQVAFDWIANYGPVLGGYWEIVMTAGTFANRATLKAGLLSENPIEITGYDVGVHPAVPTTIISEGAGASAVGIFVRDGSRINVKNVKFTGFNGSSSSAGLKASNGAEITTSNCHFDSCYWGVSGETRSRIVIPDGIISNCGTLNGGGGTGAGIRSLQLNSHAIGVQNAGTQANSVIFQNCYQAVIAQESSTGHVDWCTVQDCTYGLVVRVNARINLDGTSFKRNAVDIRAEANGHVFVSSNVVFAPAGVDESANKIMTGSGGNVTSDVIVTGVELQYATMDKVFTRQAPNQTINSITATTIYTATLKTPLWRNDPTNTSPMKKIAFRANGVITGTTNNKKINFKLGGLVATVTFPATESGAFAVEGQLYFTGRTAQQIFIRGAVNGGVVRCAKAANTLVLTTDVAITLDASVDNAADSILIDFYELSYTG